MIILFVAEYVIISIFFFWKSVEAGRRIRRKRLLKNLIFREIDK